MPVTITSMRTHALLRLLAASFVAATVSIVASAAKASADDPPSTPESTPAPMTHVLMTTSAGEILVRLDAEKAPITVTNFLAYVADNAYDGTIFHRVIPDFMIQGGGFNPDMSRRPTRAPIRNEAKNGLPNLRGTIAMARLNAPDSATSQFFINVTDNPALDYSEERRNPGYAVFGEVVDGMDVVDAIRRVPTGRSGGHGDVPVDAVTITKVIALDAESARKRLERAKSEGAGESKERNGKPREEKTGDEKNGDEKNGDEKNGEEASGEDPRS